MIITETILIPIQKEEDCKLDRILEDIQKIKDAGEGKLIIFIKDSIISGWQKVEDIKL
jgi:hypothetical protein